MNGHGHPLPLDRYKVDIFDTISPLTPACLTPSRLVSSLYFLYNAGEYHSFLGLVGGVSVFGLVH
jgi:hypothetical protein